ncbi:MAG TPA: hypothetical protein VM389_05880, partial [Phycisphaerae bacterium]|nr:hypothetical protein [Phycisphaerae bacterium]
MNGMVDANWQDAHAWGEFGVRPVGGPNYNPNNQGIWVATDYVGVAGGLNPDPPGAPTQDIDDKFILQKVSGHGEGDYNLPGTPPVPGNNHRIWFDRDGVDQWQANSPLAVAGGTYNTGGRYDIVLTLTATSATTGEAYMTVNGLAQGFETNSDWSTMELSPAGMTFNGDMTQMQVFYGLNGYGATHSVRFEDIEVEGTPIPAPAAVLLGGLGLGLVGWWKRRSSS